ncbi:MAG: 3-dehydroquinate synthase [Candidatus Bipolaricaulia bacterium]
MNKVSVETEGGSYPILIETSSLPAAGEAIEERLGQKRAVIITDETVDDLYGLKLDESLRSNNISFDKLVVEPGENSKSPGTAEYLYEELAELNLHRDSVVLAFGGGVVGDLAGFVGSTFLRGLSVIQIPTTLLAQVDSSVGGKTAVNLPQGKNLVGTFHQPDMVLIDPVVLTTLSRDEVKSGLGEVLKYGLVWDENLFRETVDKLELVEKVEKPEALEPIIARCCEIKADVVGCDERDRGVRQILNFGHTIGHAIEAGSGRGEIKHGEAVIWGMLGETWISSHRGYIGDEVFQGLVDPLTRLSLPELPELTEGELLEYINRDKKVRNGTINSVLLKNPGEDVTVEEVTEAELTAAWNFLKEVEVKNR